MGNDLDGVLMTLRYDSFKVATTGLKPDANGYLKINKAYPSKAGILTYKQADGSTVKEFRPPEEVFREDSMQSLELVPFSVEHKGGILSPSSVKEQSTGSTGGPIGRDGDFLTCSIGVHRSDAISQILDEGVLELSAGYTCDVLEESGTYKGQRYDRKQTNIRYNHLTLTRKARGEGCRIRLDGGDAILEEEAQATNQPTEDKIMKVVKLKVPAYTIGAIKFDSESIEIVDEQSALVEGLLSKLALFDVEAGKTQAKLDSVTGERDNALVEVEKFKTYIPPGQLNQEVNEKAKVLAYAKDFKLDSDTDSMSANDIKKAIIKKVAGTSEEKFDKAGYLEGAWDSLEPKLKKEVKGEPKNPNSWAGGANEEYQI